MFLPSGVLSLVLMAQIPPSLYKYDPVNPSPIDYTSTSVTSHSQQRLNVFLPDSPPPSGGYPVLLYVHLGNFVGSALLEEVTPRRDALLWQCLDSGIAVVGASVTVYDPQLLPGQGLFFPPGYTHPMQNFQYTDGDYHCAEKDCVMIAQYVKFYAGQSGHPLQDVDGTRVAVTGYSASSFAWKWVFLGPDRSGSATFGANPSPQERVPTDDLRAGLLGGSAVWIDAFDSALPQRHFPKTNSLDPGTIGESDPLALELASAMTYTDFGSLPELYLVYGDVPQVYDYAQDQGACQCEWVSGTETGVHSAWSGFAWMALGFTQNTTRLVLNNPDLDFPFIHLGLHDDLVFNRLYRDQWIWLQARL